MKKDPDLILLHAPSVYDFRKKSIMFGPVSDLVPSTPIFEMYPIGFLTLSNYLNKRGISIRIINIAYRMYHEPNFNVERFIQKLNPLIFGIDLHWLPHCQGAIEISKIVKKYHPDIPIVFGGFSSSYFWEELIKFDSVDFIIQGDSTEEPLFLLIKYLKKINTLLKNDKNLNNYLNSSSLNSSDSKDSPNSNKVLNFSTILNLIDNEYENFNIIEDLRKIPNLVYKKNSVAYNNPVKCISKDLSEIDFDYRIMFKQVLRYKDLRSIMPFHDWFRYPITTIPIVRGCKNICANCGGSKFAFNLFASRIEPAFRQPKKLVEEIRLIRKYIKSPIFLLGDLNSAGKDYVKEFFGYAKSLENSIQIFFEFFEPPKNWFFESAASVFKNVCYEISPDTHDENIRGFMGKTYTNEDLFNSISFALSKGALRFDLYFMTGLPHQTKESILETVDFCKDFYKKLNWNPKFMPFISPMAPFLDPGSRIFEEPEKFGYKLLAKTLKEHINLITKPSWKYILNYESDFITKDDLVFSTYKAAIGLNRLKAKAGSITFEVMKQNEQRIENALKIMKEIDDIMILNDSNLIEKKLSDLRDKTYKYSLSTVCEKKELDFPLFNRSFNWFNIIKDFLLRKY